MVERTARSEYSMEHSDQVECSIEHSNLGLKFDLNITALLATLSSRAHITNTDCFSASFVNVFLGFC